MPFKYVAIKDTKNGADGDACAFNSALLAEGVQGVECVEARRPTSGETLDYTPSCNIYPVIPWGCFLSSVEVYANGARNFYVRKTQGEQVMVGYLLIRPLKEI